MDKNTLFRLKQIYARARTKILKAFYDKTNLTSEMLEEFVIKHCELIAAGKKSVFSVISHGNLSIVDGCICQGGNRFYDMDGEIHRDNGPAIIYDNGEEWFNHGQLHREGGPAVDVVFMGSGGARKEYWLHGTLYFNEVAYNKALKANKVGK